MSLPLSLSLSPSLSIYISKYIYIHTCVYPLEAYALVGEDGRDSFGREALDTLIKLVEATLCSLRWCFGV